MAELRNRTAPDKTSIDVPTEMTKTIEIRTRRPARARVANVWKKLRSQNPRIALKRISRSAIEATGTKYGLDGEGLEAPSVISDLTTTFYCDDMSLDNGKGPIKHNGEHMKSVKTSKPSQCTSPSSMATLPIRSSNLPDYTLSESFGTWRE